MRYDFSADYSEGIHPDLLAHVVAGNEGQQPAYGRDEFCADAADRIRRRFAVDADVHFVTGATQANLLTLSAMLESYQGVLAPETGHIAVHETGAVEATGHKVLTVQGVDGRLTPEGIDAGLATHSDEHTVMPAVAFLTQATEAGSVYRCEDFLATVGHARERGLKVFLDGARLAMALASPSARMRPEDLGAAGVAAFTVGGTKVGGMFGEAIVLLDEDLRRNFRYRIKQRGALLAKGRFLGLQFQRFFAGDDLWLRLGAEANERARQLADGLTAAGAALVRPQEINQVFVRLPDDVVEALRRSYGFLVWEPAGAEASVIRLVTSWATPPAAVEAFLADAERALATGR